MVLLFLLLRGGLSTGDLLPEIGLDLFFRCAVRHRKVVLLPVRACDFIFCHKLLSFQQLNRGAFAPSLLVFYGNGL
jgi:hypothetical protein